MSQKKIALVTGANRGLGFETCRQLSKLGYQVILTSRSMPEGKRAVEKLSEGGAKIVYAQLDPTDAGSVEAAARFVEKEFGRLDVLVNNAGIFVEAGTALEPDIGVVQRTFETNTLGPLRVCAAFVPLMKKHNFGRIVNVSSGMGQLSEMGTGYPAYRLSKTALNSVTRMVSEETKGTGILVNSVCPGWVKTDMGGAQAPRSLEEGGQSIVWAATLPDNGPTGGFFRDGKPLPW